MTSKTKKPGSRMAVLAGPVIKTHEDETMNLHRNITPEAGLPASDPPKDIGDVLSTPINGADRMASVLATLLERALAEDMKSTMGLADAYFINRDDVNDLLFSVYQVQQFIRDIDAAFMEATR